MNSSDIIVVGGSAAGLTAAITARRHNSEKKILIIRAEEKVLIPCGIPYIFGTVGSPEKNLLPDELLKKNNIDLLIANATDINREKKIIQTDKGDIQYDRLILATGSLPTIPPIPGVNKDGVFPIVKDIERLRNLQEQLQKAKDVVIIGGGFIGIEFADEIMKMGGKNVTILEIAPHCLSLSYDTEFCQELEKVLESRKINIGTSTKAVEIKGNDRVESVLLSGGNEIKADVIVLGIGTVGNVELAKKSDLKLGVSGGIAVDRTMMTSDNNIFACGDCAEKISFFGGRTSPLKLASIATLEGRIAGANLYGIRRENTGSVGIWSTAVGDFAMGTAGLTEAMAKDRGYQVVVANCETPNRHPGGMPGMSKVKVKLVFEKNSSVILGGQVRGNTSAGEIINIISACVERRMTADDIAMFQIGTHPALTASPIVYPLVNAAEIALGEMNR